VQVAGNGFVFGAFTPLSWPADNSLCSHVADPSGRTFLFSLVNAHGRAVKLRLKEAQRDKALTAYGSGNGPCFGNSDLCLMYGKAATDPQGSYGRPDSFELDHETEAAAGLPPIDLAYDKSLLAGDDGKGQANVCFAAAEIEVYQL
jgi:hypothetical protein